MTGGSTPQSLLLQAEAVRAGYYADAPVLDGVDLQAESGTFLALIGPNGSGKSTLLRVLAGVLAPWSGSVRLDGTDLRRLSRRELARSIAVVPQETIPPFGFTVAEMVAMGRHPYLRPFGGLGPDDRGAIDGALERTGIAPLAGRSILELSGGERQRVVIARALAQQPRLLLLDEPTNHLDINHQVEVLNLLYDLNRDDGLTIVCVTHDLNAAAQYADRVVLLARGGRVHAAGNPTEVIDPDHVASVYGIEVELADDGGRPRIWPRLRGTPRPEPVESLP